MVPTMFVRLLRLPDEVKRRYDLSSLRFIVHGAAPCPPQVKRAMIEWWGPVINEYFGSTETGIPVWHSAEEALAKPGTVGRAIEGGVVKIFRPDGSLCDVNEPGEIFMRQMSVPDFDYHGKAEARAEAGRDGLVSVGDVGYLDEDGYLFLCDRKRDMVISGGVNIYPAEIENALIGMDGVRDCAVFGVPDDEFGERLFACIEPEANAALSPAAVQEFLRGRLANFKVPKDIQFMDAMPREATGKIFKRKLRDLYTEGRAARDCVSVPLRVIACDEAIISAGASDEAIHRIPVRRDGLLRVRSAMTEPAIAAFRRNPNSVLNVIAVAKRSSDGAKIAACEEAGIETMPSTDFVVARNDLQQCKVIETQLPDAAALPDDALLVKVTRFAFTANNITYAVLGDHLKYWQLFPAPEGFGNVPVWGFGEVIASKHPGIAAGETLFGYFPMATHLVIEAADVSKRGLRDAAAHRQGVAPVYNAYTRVSGDPAFRGQAGRLSGAAAAVVHAVVPGR